MSKIPPHPTDPSGSAPAAGRAAGYAAGEPGLLESLRLPGVLFFHSWGPFHFAAAQLLTGLAPLAELLGLCETTGADVRRWASALDPTIPQDPGSPQEGRAD